MNVLIISANSLPASPSGPAYLAGAVLQAGHAVDVFECLFAADLEAELSAKLEENHPDVVAISIRLVFGDTLDPAAPLGTRHTDLRPRVREIVDDIRRNSGARIVLGGPGFNYYARDWLNYLELDYGIRGEGEEAFPLYLNRLASGGDIYSIPGCVARTPAGFHEIPFRRVEDLDAQALPAYDLFDGQRYIDHNITPAIFTRRGCAFSCTYCPYAKLEGKRYRLKSPRRVIAEIRHILGHTPWRQITICDNNFNAPRRHAEMICQALAREHIDFHWGTGDLRPGGVTTDFCKLLKDSGCNYVNLAVESAADSQLARMKRGYSVRQVRQALEALSRSSLPYGASLMIGAPGETPQTIAETLAVISDYPLPLGVWVTIGIYLWTDYQDIVTEARRSGDIPPNQDLFAGAVYLSPELSRAYLQDLAGELGSRQGYSVQFNQPNAQWLLG